MQQAKWSPVHVWEKVLQYLWLAYSHVYVAWSGTETLWEFCDDCVIQ